ncbi:MAG: hypothetical protein ABR522_07860 [Marinobacter sp.]
MAQGTGYLTEVLADGDMDALLKALNNVDGSSQHRRKFDFDVRARFVHCES